MKLAPKSDQLAFVPLRGIPYGSEERVYLRRNTDEPYRLTWFGEKMVWARPFVICFHGGIDAAWEDARKAMFA